MARVSEDQPLVPSLLDRLLDDQPSETRESPKSQNQVLAEMRRSVRRDLENLLNTRVIWIPHDDEMTELHRSLVDYGVPDITSVNLASEAGRKAFLRRVERAIEIYEPRFIRVRVKELENAGYLDRTLRFRIDALMRAYPAPEPIVFDSSVEPATGNFEVKGTPA